MATKINPSQVQVPNDATKFLNGTGAFTVPTGAGQVSTIGVTIDGAGSAPSTGSKGYIQVPYAGTIVGWSLVANVSGSAQITVKKCADASFPTTVSIDAAAPPTLSSQQKNESTTLTGWTTSVTANDWFEFNLDSVSVCTRLTLQIRIQRT